ncbi:glomulin, FKBP associated protein a [Lepisosteus oculatus]|uniref:glomulin, FKBP associated protein a n=1 Tax=Lepisosteus oculatus TaxID=7918 RepID=UPI003713A2FB
MALEQLYDMLQRCQVLADDSFKPEDYEQFQSAGRACLERGGAAQVLEVVQDEKNKAIVRSMGWNLLGPLVQVILQKDEKSLQHCLSIFAHLLDVCSPKELLVGLLEQVEDADPDKIAETISLLLPPLQSVLLKLGDKKAASVGMALSTILNQLSRLPVPYTREQEEDDAHGLCRCCAALPGFVGPLVEEAKQTRPGGRGAELRTELLKFCMKSLREPLLQAQLGDDPDSPADSPLRRFASQILATLLSLGESLPHLLFHHVLKKKAETGFLEEDARYSRESLACLAYLLFVQRAAIDRFPAVFSPVFVLRCNMQYVDILLSRTEESRVSKGLDLYEQSLVRTEDGSLPVELLELRVFLSVPQNLVKVMTLCPIPHLRTKGLAVFQLSIDKLDMEAKYKFFRCLLKTSHHAGVEGYIIKNIKNQIDFALKPGNGSVWFSGAQLLPLLRSVLTLPEGPETDLLQNLDRVMESLNLLRYLLIRDKEWDNQTGIWTELYKIEENYLKPLRTGLNMSKAHYEAELKSTKEIKKLKGQKESRPVCTVTVGNEKLPNMTPEMQVQVLHSALFTFDLMESVLTRIEEIIEVKVKP